MRRSKEGVEYLVEYKDSNDLEWVPMNFVKRNHPQKVINFYENCIVWDWKTLEWEFFRISKTQHVEIMSNIFNYFLLFMFETRVKL